MGRGKGKGQTELGNMLLEQLCLRLFSRHFKRNVKSLDTIYHNVSFTKEITKVGIENKTSQESQNAAQRTSHRLSRCQNVLTKRYFFSFFLLMN